MKTTTPTFDARSCIKTFDASFPAKVQRALVLAVVEATREAAEIFQGKGVQRPQRKQNQAGLRRALLETKMRIIAEQYNLDDAMDIIHEGKRSANLIIQNGYIALTQKYDKLDYARYRETLARMNSTPLFAKALKVPDPEDLLYAIINYTLEEFDLTGATVASIDIVFPAPIGNMPVAVIDLLARNSKIDNVDEEAVAEVGVKTKKAADARRASKNPEQKV